MEDNKFFKLYSLNVNDRTEKRKGEGGKKELTYLSWAWAWAEFVKVYPDATYEIEMFDGKPYVYDETLGYMVFTNVSAGGLNRRMWLPVMNSANKAMKAASYSYFVNVKDWNTNTTRREEKFVAAATMFDVNKTIMRCLTKNLAMFGLGLYIYAGEDVPEDLMDEDAEAQGKPERVEPLKFDEDDIQRMVEAAIKLGMPQGTLAKAEEMLGKPLTELEASDANRKLIFGKMREAAKQIDPNWTAKK